MSRLEDVGAVEVLPTGEVASAGEADSREEIEAAAEAEEKRRSFERSRVDMMRGYAETGGCHDGLVADGVNDNEGAESTLAFWQALIAVEQAGRRSFRISHDTP